jgi:hypothetical protein
MTLGSDATGDIYYRDASGFLERLAASTDGYVLTSTGAGSIPAWEAAASSGAALTGSTNNTIVTVTGADAIQGEASLIWDGATLVVGDTAAVNGADTAQFEIPGNNDGVSFYDGTNRLAYIGNNADDSLFQMKDSAGTVQFYVLGDESPQVFIGDSANADMTTGLTINQGANDDALLIFKSSDVDNESIGSWETDSFAQFGKLNNANGGLVIRTMANDALSQGFEVQSYAGQPSTTPATSATCSAEIWGYQHSNGAVGNMVADGLCFGVGTYTGSTGKILFCVDEDGDYHYDGVDGGAYDSYVDAELVRATSHVLTSPKDLVRSKWDEMVRYQKQDLIDAGLLGACSPEDEAKGHRGLVNGPAMQRLHTGAIWQNHTDMMEIARVLSPEQKAALPEHIQQKLLEN